MSNQITFVLRSLGTKYIYADIRLILVHVQQIFWHKGRTIEIPIRSTIENTQTRNSNNRKVIHTGTKNTKAKLTQIPLSEERMHQKLIAERTDQVSFVYARVHDVIYRTCFNADIPDIGKTYILDDIQKEKEKTPRNSVMYVCVFVIYCP